MKQKLAQNRKRKLEELNGDFVLPRSSDSVVTAAIPSRAAAAGEAPVLRPQDDELCERCKAIDLDEAFKSHPAHATRSGREIVSFGEIDSQWRDSRCPLCRLFAAIHGPLTKPARYKNRGHHLRAIDSRFMLYGRKEMTESCLESAVVLGVFQGATRKQLSTLQLRDGFARGAIARVPVESKDVPEGSLDTKLIDPLKIDYDRVRKWIEHCRKFHSRTCEAGETALLPNSRFIDCFTRKIVKIDAQEDYYALSYVWSESDRGALADESGPNDDCLPDVGVSQTIEDAITAVKNLGARYLWVDRYCINQHDPLDKHSQVAKMDQIYAAALATIVVVSAKQATSGLPGVGLIPRTPQPHAFLKDRLLVSTLPHVSFPITESRWVRRAWTYQEAILSRRCLFFTDRQVYFLCRAMDCCEVIGLLPPTTVAPPQASPTLSLRMFNIHDPGQEQGSIKPAKGGLWEFFNHLRQFRSRRMSFDSDSLNAFRGILATSEFRSFWGVPFAVPSKINSRDNNVRLAIGFARGMWWYPKNKDLKDWPKNEDAEDMSSYFHRRLPGFPSWSWAGWAGEIASLYLPQLLVVADDDKCNQVSERVFRTTFRVKDAASGETCTLSSLYNSGGAEKTNIIPEFPCTLELTTTIYRLRIQRNVVPNPRATAACSCHPTTAHEGTLDYRTPEAQRAWFCVSPQSDSLYAEKLDSQLWDCLVLFKGEDGDTRLFIVEWKGKMAYVVGMLELTEDFFEESGVKGERRVVELG